MGLSGIIDLLEKMEYDFQKATNNEGKPVEIPVINGEGKPVRVMIARDPETKKIAGIIFK